MSAKTREFLCSVSTQQLEKLLWCLSNATYEPIRDMREQYERSFHFYGKQAGLDPDLVHAFLCACCLHHNDTPPEIDSSDRKLRGST